IYVYDSNYPDTETYLYAADGKIRQAPYTGFGTPIDCIQLIDVQKYFEAVKGYDETRCVYAESGTLDKVTTDSKEAVNSYPMAGSVNGVSYTLYELPGDAAKVTLDPADDGSFATFIYCGEEHSFGYVDGITTGTFETVGTVEEKENVEFRISGSCGEKVSYVFNTASGELVISGEGAMTDYEKNGSPFRNDKSVRSLVIGEGVTSIGSYAFEGCEALDNDSVGYPQDVKIGKGAFIRTGVVIAGDVNGDGQVLADDARLALRNSAKLEELDEQQFRAADVDGNGKVLADDARQILRYSAKLQSTFDKAK
nr:hypothetical protein [Clostridia bacterium]